MECWGGRVPSVQWRVDTHEHHTLHLRASRRGFVSARTSVQHTYDLHLDVAGGAPVAVCVPAVLAFAQPQALLQASWGNSYPQQQQQQQYQPPQPHYPYQGPPQPQYGQYGQPQPQPMQMQHMAQPNPYYQHPPQYSNYVPQQQQQHTGHMADPLLSQSAPSEQ